MRCQGGSNPGASVAEPPQAPQASPAKPKRGCPKGSRNRNKTDVLLTDELKHLQTMVNALLARVGDLISVHYLVLDGYFGHNNALQIWDPLGLSIIHPLNSGPDNWRRYC